MEKQMRTVLMPEYLTKFKCTGDECIDTCCKGWKIYVDKKTYKKYTNIKNSTFKQSFKKNIKRNRNNPNDESYAFLHMNSSDLCPFLSKNRLCSIHSELGADYLPKICSVYPRITNIVDDTMIRTGSISCYEVAKLALLNKEPMKLVKVYEPVNERYIISKSINPSHPKYLNKPQKYFYELRDFSIELIQNRNFKIEERILILGLFLEEIQKLVEENNLNKIPLRVNHWKTMFEDKIKINFKTKLNFENQITFQSKILLHIIKPKVKGDVYNKNWSKFFNEVLCSLNLKEDIIIEHTLEKYKKAYENYYEPFISEHEYILENFIVNYIYKNNFPFCSEKSIYDEYVLLNFLYGMLKLHLVGIAGFYKENFDINLVLRLIQTLASGLEHNPKYLYKILDFFKENKFTDMKHMAMLSV